MRWRAFEATLTAAALLIGSGAMAWAQTDPLFSDLDAPGASATSPDVAKARALAESMDAPAGAPAEAAKAPTAAPSPAPVQPAAFAPAGGQAPNPLYDSEPTGSTTHATEGAAVEKLGPEDPATAPKKDTGKGLDPEPDIAVTPVPPAPSNDPIDAAKASKANPTGGATLTPAQQAEEPLPPLNAAIKAALDKRDAIEIRGAHASERRKEREAVAFFYAAHGFAPLWSENGAPVAAVAPVLARLARAGEDALDIPAAPAALTVQGTPEAVVASELALSEAVVFYARQATGSRVDPRAISPLIGAKPALADPAEVLDAVAAAGVAAGDTLQALNPVDPRYVSLREKLAEMRLARAPTARGPIPAGPTLRVGMRDPRMPLIRARFSLDTTLTDPDDLEYDTQVAEAVASFQRANGLPVSGTLTRRTIEALSGGQPSRLEAALIANMEMWRWMPRELGADRIEVNVPDFTVTVFHDNTPVATNRVVVGKTDTPTPLFSNTMKYLIVNPVWNVPESIVKKEMMATGHLRARGFDVSYRDGQIVVKQPAGERNALGRIKFMFPNDYSVYLHDTPSKSLFSASKRAFSHGCVRVDQPFDFAESVLNDGLPEGGKIVWTQKRLKSMLGDKERYVNLPKPLPIHIEYFTVGVDATTSRLQMHDDVYDYARKVAAALGRDG